MSTAAAGIFSTGISFDASNLYSQLPALLLIASFSPCAKASL